FDTTRSAVCSREAYCAEIWNECGSAFGFMSVVTSAASPTSSLVTSPRMFVVTTTCGLSLAPAEAQPEAASAPTTTTPGTQRRQNRADLPDPARFGALCEELTSLCPGCAVIVRPRSLRRGPWAWRA